MAFNSKTYSNSISLCCVIKRRYQGYAVAFTFLMSLTLMMVSFNFLFAYQQNVTYVCDSSVLQQSVLRAIKKKSLISPTSPNHVQRSTPTSSKRNPNHHTPTRALNVKTTMEALAMNLSDVIINNVAVYVDNTTNTSVPVTVNKTYLIENSNLCTAVKNLTVLVIVHTAPDHFDRRDNIRRTWTNESYFGHLGQLRVLFLLGRTKDKKIQNKVEHEFVDNTDLLQGNFIDSYTNLTNKGVMGYKWISERCRNAKLILKVDDDWIIDTYRLFEEYVPRFENKTKQIFCNHIGPDLMPILRQNNSKWYVSHRLFSGKSYYPRYCSGFAVLITNDVIPAIYRSASITPFFWVDDVYLYGLAPGRVKGIQYEGFNDSEIVMLNSSIALACYRNDTQTCNYLVVGGISRQHVDDIWSLMSKAYHSRKAQEISAKNEQTADSLKK